MIASSAPDGDLVVESAIAGLAQHTGPSGMSAAATEFRFDHVTAKPLVAGNVADLRDDVSRGQRRPSLDSRHGHAGSVLSGGRAHRQQPFGDGLRPGAGALPRAGRGTGVNGDRAAPAHFARDAGHGSRRPGHAGAGQQAGGTGSPRAIVQRHGWQARDVVRRSGRRSRDAKES